MKTLLIVGYNAFDLGIFDEKDMKLTVIKTAIRKNLCLLYTSPSPRDCS